MRILLLVAILLAIIIAGSFKAILKLMYPIKYKELVFQYAGENNIDPYLVFSIIKAESGFDPDATSRKNARGLMQITDSTGNWGAEKLEIDNFIVDDLYLPEINIRIGCWYISQLMKEFNNDMHLVISAYNAGSGNVSSWLKNRDLSRDGKVLDRIPFKETENYLRKVNKYYEIYRKLYGKG